MMEELKKEFVLYEQATTLKELGFDKPCFAYRDSEYDVHYQLIEKPMLECDLLLPTYSQAFRWFREKHNIFAEPSRVSNVIDGPTTGFFYFISDDKEIKMETDTSKTYEAAELACLKKLIEIVKNKKS